MNLGLSLKGTSHPSRPKSTGILTLSNCIVFRAKAAFDKELYKDTVNRWLRPLREARWRTFVRRQHCISTANCRTHLFLIFSRRTFGS